MLLLSAGVPRPESLEARQQFRLCLGEREQDASLAACRKALELGLPPDRVWLARDVLASRLVSLERWEEAVAALRELTLLRPDDGGSLLRLGSALLHGLDRPAEAVETLRRAVSLTPSDARAHGELALALQQLGDSAPAVAEYEEALRLDPSYLEGRPSARLAFEAARRGEGWP